MHDKKVHVLFVCTGNMARSPMAEGILKQEIQNRSIRNLTVSSAGLMAISETHAAENAVIVSRENGVDISAHRSRFLTRFIIDSADIVFVMEEAHKKNIEELMPDSLGKVYLLKAFGAFNMGGEVEDPVGGDKDIYRACFRELKEEINRILPLLLSEFGIE